MDELHRFSDLPEPLRAAIFQAAWRDSAGWRDPASRKQLRLVCRQARAAVDETIQWLSVGDEHEQDAAALAACIHAVGSGRFPALREWCFDVRGLPEQLAGCLIPALAHALPPHLQSLLLFGACFGQPTAAPALAKGMARTALDGVKFHGTGMDAAVFRRVANGLGPSLEVLIMHGNSISPGGAAALARVAAGRLPALRELNLARCNVGSAGARALAQVAWGSLETLDLEDNGIMPAGVAALSGASVTHFSALRQLNLGMNLFGDVGVKALVRRPWRRLQELQLYYNDIGVAGAASLAAAGSRCFPALNDLSLNMNGIGTEGIRALLQPAPWAVLQSLRLDMDGADGEGMAALAAASGSQLPALRELSLLGAAMCGADIAALAEGEWRHLERLELRDLSFEDADIDDVLGGLMTLAAGASRFPALCALSLLGFDLRKEQLEALQTAWPDLSWYKTD